MLTSIASNKTSESVFAHRHDVTTLLNIFALWSEPTMSIMHNYQPIAKFLWSKSLRIEWSKSLKILWFKSLKILWSKSLKILWFKSLKKTAVAFTIIVDDFWIIVSANLSISVFLFFRKCRFIIPGHERGQFCSSLLLLCVLAFLGVRGSQFWALLVKGGLSS